MGLHFGLTKDYLFKEMTGFHLIYSVKGNHWNLNSYGIRDYNNLEMINVFCILSISYIIKYEKCNFIWSVGICFMLQYNYLEIYPGFLFTLTLELIGNGKCFISCYNLPAFYR